MKLNNNASEKNAGGMGGVDGTGSMDSAGNEDGLDSASAEKKGTDTEKNNAYNRKKTNKVKENPSATETEKSYDLLTADFIFSTALSHTASTNLTSSAL